MLHLAQTTDMQSENPIAMARHFSHAAYDLYQRNTPYNSDTFDRIQKQLNGMDKDTQRLSELYTAQAISGFLCPASKKEAAALEANLSAFTNEVA